MVGSFDASIDMKVGVGSGQSNISAQRANGEIETTIAVRDIFVHTDKTGESDSEAIR